MNIEELKRSIASGIMRCAVCSCRPCDICEWCEYRMALPELIAEVEALRKANTALEARIYSQAVEIAELKKGGKDEPRSKWAADNSYERERQRKEIVKREVEKNKELLDEIVKERDKE